MGTGIHYMYEQHEQLANHISLQAWASWLCSHVTICEGDSWAWTLEPWPLNLDPRVCMIDSHTCQLYQEVLFCRYRHLMWETLGPWPTCVCVCVCDIVTWLNHVFVVGVSFIVSSRKSGVLVGSSYYCIVYYCTTRSDSCVMTVRGGRDLFPPFLYPSVRRTPWGSCTSCMSWPRGMRHSITCTVCLWTVGTSTI